MPVPTVTQTTGIGSKPPPALPMPVPIPGLTRPTRKTSMTRQEAYAYLDEYRGLLKAWTMAVGGFSNDDADLLYRKLEDGQQTLAQIALDFPEKSYSIDMLINSRSRTWAGFASERLPRPANRYA